MLDKTSRIANLSRSMVIPALSGALPLRSAESPHGAQSAPINFSVKLSFFGRCPLEARGTDVFCARAVNAVIRILFKAMGDPTRHPAHREDGRKEINGDIEAIINACRVKIHIR